MTVFLLRRIGYSLVTIILASVIVFALSRMSGDPRLLYLNAFSHVGPGVGEAWGRKLGLDKPLPLQYLYWLRDVLLGDWGESIDTGIPVWTAVTDRLPLTLKLTGGGFVFAVLVGIPLGVLSGVYRSSFWDYMGRTMAVLGQSVPAFWLAIVLILIFSVKLELLPAAGQGGISHYIMPSIIHPYRRRHSGNRSDYPHRSHPEFPRRGYPAAQARLGQYGLLRQKLHRLRVVDCSYSRRRNSPRRRVAEFPGRLAARLLRPASAPDLGALA